MSDEAAAASVLDVFNRVMPEIKTKATEKPPASPPAEVQKPAETTTRQPVDRTRQPVEEPVQAQEQEAQQPSEESHRESVIPSSIEEFLDGKTKEIGAPAEDFPEELPQGQNGEEVKSNWKRLREAYKTAAEKVKALEAKPAADPELQTRLTKLESDNKQMAEILAKTSIEHDPRFQNDVIRPLNASWNDAVRIVKEAGADPAELQRIVTLKGKAQYEALDQLFEGMPESAKLEATTALRQFKHFSEVRRNALQNVGQTAEQLRQQEAARMIQVNKQVREQMDESYTNAVNLLRDKGKVFLLQKTEDPNGSWWNEQVDKIVNGGREFYLNNTDMDKAARAMVMSRMVDPLMKLLQAERAARIKNEKIIKERLGSEPSLSESGGNIRNGGPPDLKEPFNVAFMRELQKQHAAGVR